MIYIYAPTIKEGGGKVVLQYTLKLLQGKSYVALITKEVLKVNWLQGQRVKVITPGFLSRLKAEFWLFKNVEINDSVICMGNLPPIFKLKSKVIVYLQNAFLIDPLFKNLSTSDFFKYSLLKIFFIFFSRNVNLYLVQTNLMKEEFLSKFGINYRVEVLPFVEMKSIFERDFINDCKKITPKYDFIYVASGEKHKNHIRLIDAWIFLAKQNLYPSLCLTLNLTQSRVLEEKIHDAISKYGVKISNVGHVSRNKVYELYVSSGALIYPSLVESFGIPLMEAEAASIGIVASELDYVRELVDPNETFNPYSPRSIASAVKRYMKIELNTNNYVSVEESSEMLKKVFL